MDYLNYCIKGNSTVREGMKKIDNVIYKILFIIDEGKLIATLTDGDVRRYLLKGGSLNDLIQSAANLNPVIANNLENAIKIYNESKYIAIPIVDQNGKLIDVYFGTEISLINNQSLKSTPLIINAGGRGTRLEPYTKILPKPLIPVGELPIIEHIMKEFEKFGTECFHIIVNYKKELLKTFFLDGEEIYDIKWYDENQPLGTGGGLSLLKGKIKDTFFFTNCDILIQSNYESMLKYHKENKNKITMICVYKNITIPYGVVKMGENGSIESMQEKPELSFLTNTGMYIVEPEVIDDIEDNIPIGFPDIIEQQRMKGNKVSIYPISENEWMDMGQLSGLELMQKRLSGD